MQQTHYICVAYNYLVTANASNNCELLAENGQTATPELYSQWVYSLRPNCAGMKNFTYCLLKGARI